MRCYLLVLLALGLIAAAMAHRYCSRDTDAARKPGSGAALGDAEKERIRKFWAVFRSAGALSREGRFQEASAGYREALALDPRHEGALYNLANCYFELNKFAEALPPLMRLVEVNPLSQRGHLQIGLLRSCPLAGGLFDLDAAELAFRRAFQINQEETGAHLQLAAVALVKGDEEEALEHYALVNRSNFRAVEGYYVRAYIRWKQGKPEAARSLLGEALRQSKHPVTQARVPGEGDTRTGKRLPPSTMAGKRLIKPFWTGLPERLPEDGLEALDLAAEFRALETHLTELRGRIR